MRLLLHITFWLSALSPALLYARTYSLGSTLGSWALPAGNDYYHIDAQVPAGQTAGVPSVVGGPTGSLKERSLFMAHDNGGVMSFGAGMPATTLWNYESGSDPSPASIVNDLKHMPNGQPLLIGASTSPRALQNGEEATVWELNGSTLRPKSLGFPTGFDEHVSLLGGGNSVDGYAGSNGADPIFVPPTGGGQALEQSVNSFGGIGLDLEAQTLVGEVSSHAAFWKLSSGAAWNLGNLQLPTWSDGAGSISDVAGNLMGGYLYKADADDIVPVIWNTDGTLNKVFDLPGYSVAEMVVDEGSVVTLLNQGTDGQFSGPSRLYADGWNDSRLYFGDIVPALPSGSSGTVIDFSSGGGLWTLLKVTDGNSDHYDVSDLPSSAYLVGDYDHNGTVDGNDYLEWQRQFGNTVVPWSGADGNGNGQIDAADYVAWRNNFGQTAASGASLPVPEPSTIAFFFCAAMFGRSFNYLCAHWTWRRRGGTAR